jgi:hypothetical protein
MSNAMLLFISSPHGSLKFHCTQKEPPLNAAAPAESLIRQLPNSSLSIYWTIQWSVEAFPQPGISRGGQPARAPLRASMLVRERRDCQYPVHGR